MSKYMGEVAGQGGGASWLSYLPKERFMGGLIQ
jgi:hypothetical protein